MHEASHTVHIMRSASQQVTGTGRLNNGERQVGDAVHHTVAQRGKDALAQHHGPILAEVGEYRLGHHHNEKDDDQVTDVAGLGSGNNGVNRHTDNLRGDDGNKRHRQLQDHNEDKRPLVLPQNPHQFADDGWSASNWELHFASPPSVSTMFSTTTS